jgi:hypothetical protein
MVKEQGAIPKEMDRRLLERRLLRGQMTEEQLARCLVTLPDVSENAEEVVVVMEDRSSAPKKESHAD